MNTNYYIARIDCYGQATRNDILQHAGVAILTAITPDDWQRPNPCVDAEPMDWEDAHATVERLDDEQYVCPHGILGRPTYYIIEELVYNRLVNDNVDKYDLDDETDKMDEEEFLAWCLLQDEEYVRAHALTTFLDRLNNGVKPVDPVLRWNTREDMTIESRLRPNRFAHEVEDGAYNIWFAEPMTEREIDKALDYIATEPEA